MRVRNVLIASAFLGLLPYLASDTNPVSFYESPLGGQQRVELADHSIILLNTDSRLELWGTPANLHAKILRGEALFRLTPNLERHLMVSAGAVDVVDLGTTFDVRLATESEIQVMVAEGRVKIYANGRALYSLKENQRATVNDRSNSLTVRAHNESPDSIQRRLSWQQGVLDFSCETLSSATEQINRYNLLKIEIDSPLTGAVRISGVGFSPTDPALFARTIAATIPNMSWRPLQHPGRSPSLQLRLTSQPRQQCTPKDPPDNP